jgi:YD repeat-containing protein
MLCAFCVLACIIALNPVTVIVEFGRRILFVSVLLLAINLVATGLAWSQTPTLGAYNPIPVAPTAAALTQYARVPVSLATGTPQVNVPIYTIACGSLTLPLSLSYHSGGFKVSEHASWVGLGWSLNAGGVITRSVRGKRDNGQFEEFFGPYQRNVPDPGIPRDKTFLEQLANGVDWDSSPDLYSFNFMGHAGSFVRVADTMALLPPQPLLLEPAAFQGAGALRDVSQWRAADETGTTYWFAASETTGHAHGSDITSWYLTRVVSSSTQDTIWFDYQPYTHALPWIEQELFAVDLTGAYHIPRPDGGVTTNHYSGSGSVFSIHGQYLSRVRFTGGGQIDFYAHTGRTDLADEMRLDSLRVLTLTQRRSFVFAYVPPTGSGERLKLAQVTEAAGNVPARVHSFSYYPLKLPTNPLSKSQDHWGYFNGKNNLSLLPPIPPYPTTTPGVPILPIAGDRSVEPAYAQADLLTRITYPTGGYEAFVYEGNDTGTLPSRPTATGILGGATVTTQSPASGMPLTPTVVTYFTVELEQDVTISEYSQVMRTNAGRFPAQIFRCGEISCLFNQASLVYTFNGLGYAPGTVGGSLSNPITDVLHLEPGQYAIRAMSADGGTVGLTVSGLYFTGSPPHLAYVGGVRLLADTLYDGLSHTRDIVHSYQYRDALVTSASSSVVTSQPQYLSSVPTLYGMAGGGVYIPDDDGGMPQFGMNTTLLFKDVYTASSQSGLGGDCPVYYAHVTTTLGPGTAGITHSYFEGPDVTGGESIGAPYIQGHVGSRSQPRLLQQVDLNAAGDTVRRAVYRYAGLNARFKQFVSYACQPTPICELRDPATGYASGACPRLYDYRTARTIAQFDYLAELREYHYDLTSGARPTVLLSRYCYDNPHHLLPTRQQQVFGAGDTLTTRTKYPLDYDAVTATTETAAGLIALQTNHCLSTPVEQVQWRSRGGNRLLVAGVLHQFKALPLPNRRIGGVPQAFLTTRLAVPSQDFALALNQPTPFTQFQASALTSIGAFQQAPQYEPRTSYEQYNRQGNPLLVRRAGDVPSAFWWSTSSAQLLAEVKNAIPATCAYTSFERDSPGGWAYDQGDDTSSHYEFSDARTGRAAYRLDGGVGVRRDSLPAGEYELLFWARQRPLMAITGTVAAEEVVATALGKTGQSWQQFRLRLRLVALGSIELNALDSTHSILLDEVRLHPVGALMNSYTYEALVGLTSRTEPSGRTTTYEYDALGRLLRTRDEQGHVLTQQHYHYARP